MERVDKRLTWWTRVLTVGCMLTCTSGFITHTQLGRPLQRQSCDKCVREQRHHIQCMATAVEQPATSSKHSEAETRRAVKRALLQVFGEDIPTKTNGDSTDAAASDSAHAGTGDAVLACPTSLSQLRSQYRLFGRAASLQYKTCDYGMKFRDNGVYVDFVTTKPKLPWEASREELVMEQTFQSPLTSFLYERGWRQQFAANGFPGVAKEHEEVSEFFAPVATGGVVLDLSCGSGLMTRRLIKSGLYRRVIAADLSSSMLRETARRCRREGIRRPELIRADVSQLPVQSSSVEAVHAGAALHCWTKLAAALKEVHRVLKPGGRFFATTFLTSATLARSANNGFHFFTTEELTAAMREAGFEDVVVRQEGRGCAVVKCTKAEADSDTKA